MARLPYKRTVARWLNRPGMRGWLGSALVFVLLPGLVAALILQYRVAERRLDAGLTADVALARSAGGTFQAYVHGLLRQELAIGLAVPVQLDRSVADANGYLAASADDSPAIRAFGWVDPIGRVWVESEPGRGSTFGLALPIAVPPAQAAPQDEPAAA